MSSVARQWNRLCPESLRICPTVAQRDNRYREADLKLDRPGGNCKAVGRASDFNDYFGVGWTFPNGESRTFPHGKITQTLKDFLLMQEQATSHGQELPLGRTYIDLVQGCVAAGEGEWDNAAVMEEIRRRTS